MICLMVFSSFMLINAMQPEPEPIKTTPVFLVYNPFTETTRFAWDGSNPEHRVMPYEKILEVKYVPNHLLGVDG